MRCLPRLLILSMALIGLATTAVPKAQAAANHVVISEFASRGPSSAFDEFCEWYNPTNAQIDISGWKLQYSSQASARAGAIAPRCLRTPSLHRMVTS